MITALYVFFGLLLTFYMFLSITLLTVELLLILFSRGTKHNSLLRWSAKMSTLGFFGTLPIVLILGIFV